MFKLSSSLPSSVEKLYSEILDDFYVEVKYKVIASIKAMDVGISKMKAETFLNVVE